MILQESCEALISNCISLSSHDGPGLRTTLFFKGCPLKCKWCHNPETIQKNPEVEWNRRLCIGCQTCSSVCMNGAIDFSRDNAYLIDKGKCTQCFACVDHCPAHALKRIGKTYRVDDLEEAVLKEEALLKDMGGGVTFSGGEPAIRSKFITPLAQRLKARGIHLALDTCGYVSWEHYERLLPYMDLVLFDLKEMDPAKHLAFTGADNQLIHENLNRMAEYIQARQLPVRIWIRTPLIPDMTASKENVEAIGRFIQSGLSAYVDKWELCAFNNLCEEKYTRLGIEWELKQVELLSMEEMGNLLSIAKQSAPSIKQVIASGLNRK